MDEPTADDLKLAAQHLRTAAKILDISAWRVVAAAQAIMNEEYAILASFHVPNTLDALEW